MGKPRKFTIKIRGTGEHLTTTTSKIKLQEAVASFFLEGEPGSRVIDDLKNHLSNNDGFLTNSGFKFDHFDYLGNDVDPDDVDMF